MNIPLKRAVLLWNPHDKAHSEPRPLNGNGHAYRCSVGAVCSDYRELSSNQQTINLLVEALQAIARDNVDPASMLKALARIEGMADLFAEDCLEEIE